MLAPMPFALFGLVWFDSVWLDLAWLGLAWLHSGVLVEIVRLCKQQVAPDSLGDASVKLPVVAFSCWLAMTKAAMAGFNSLPTPLPRPSFRQLTPSLGLISSGLLTFLSAVAAALPAQKGL